MAIIYVNLILKGLKTFEQVPIIIKDQVKEILRQFVSNGNISSEQYKKITGEDY